MGLPRGHGGAGGPRLTTTPALFHRVCGCGAAHTRRAENHSPSTAWMLASTRPPRTRPCLNGSSCCRWGGPASPAARCQTSSPVTPVPQTNATTPRIWLACQAKRWRACSPDTSTVWCGPMAAGASWTGRAITWDRVSPTTAGRPCGAARRDSTIYCSCISIWWRCALPAALRLRWDGCVGQPAVRTWCAPRDESGRARDHAVRTVAGRTRPSLCEP